MKLHEFMCRTVFYQPFVVTLTDSSEKHTVIITGCRNEWNLNAGSDEFFQRLSDEVDYWKVLANGVVWVAARNEYFYKSFHGRKGLSMDEIEDMYGRTNWFKEDEDEGTE